MLLFHGGLPRSGKSYEAVVKHLIPALSKGRKVYARINGLNYEKIAELAGITVDRCRELLVELSEEQVKALEDLSFDVGSLLILDEAQNFWPEQREPLNPKLTRFVAEHGHHGLDILLMGQEFKDVHKLWKNRISQRVQFRKLDALGKGDEYAWILYKATDPQKFVEVTKGKQKYDAKYFGTYKSFVEGAEGNQLYDDSRANIWNSPMFKKWLPLFAALLAVACWKIYDTWNGGVAKMAGAKIEEKAEPKHEATGPVKPAESVAKADSPGRTSDEKKEFDLIRELSDKYRIRVSGIIKSAHRQHAIFEWYDDSMHVRERMTMLAVAQLGYTVVLDDDMTYAKLSRAGVHYVATQFPTEADGRISDAKQREIAGNPERGTRIAKPGGTAKDTVDLADGYGVNGKAGPGVSRPEI